MSHLSRLLTSSLGAVSLAVACTAPPSARHDSPAEPAARSSETDLQIGETGDVADETGDVADARREFDLEVVEARKSVERNDLLGSLPHFERALEIQPASISTHYEMGLALARLGRRRQAQAHLERVVGTGLGFEANAHTQLARIHGASGRPDEALAHFERAAALNPDRAEVRYNLGASYYRHGRFEDALAQLQLAVELEPTRREAHRWLAATYAKLGRCEEAIAGFQALLDVDDKDPAVLHEMGVCYETLGNDELARASFERALAIAKTSPRYRGLVKGLEERLATP